MGKHTLCCGFGAGGGQHVCAGDLGCVLAGHLTCVGRSGTMSCNCTRLLLMTASCRASVGRSARWISKYLLSISYTSITPPASESRLKMLHFVGQYSKTQAVQPWPFNSWLRNEPPVSSRASAGLFSLSSIFLFSVVLLPNPQPTAVG